MLETFSRTRVGMSTYVVVVISPATTTRPVVTRVSQATLLIGSSASAASRMVSEIWSAILSGWPSVTDSEVKRWDAFSFWSSAAFQAVIPTVFSAILYSPFLCCSLLRCGTCCVISVLHEGLVREHRHAQSGYPLVRQPRLCEVRKGFRSSNSSLRFRLKSSPLRSYFALARWREASSLTSFDSSLGVSSAGVGTCHEA